MRVRAGVVFDPHSRNAFAFADWARSRAVGMEESEENRRPGLRRLSSGVVVESSPRPLRRNTHKKYEHAAAPSGLGFFAHVARDSSFILFCVF